MMRVEEVDETMEPTNTQKQKTLGKRSTRTPDWSIEFEDVSSLRSVVEAAAAVMQRVVFKVSKIRGTYFLIVDGADMGYTCCVSARLQLDRVTVSDDFDENAFTFCIECKHLLISIDNPSCANASLIMEGHTRDAIVTTRTSDVDQKSVEDSSRLHTFVDEDDTMNMKEMEYKMLLEIDLTKLRDIIKKARKAHAEELMIRIYLQSFGSKQRSLVVFSIKGDLDFNQKFCHDTAHNDDGSIIVRAAADGSEDVFCIPNDPDCLAFEGKFPMEKIDAFIKSLPCRMIVAKVRNGIPLMLTHNLGGTGNDTSHIRFLVAPITEGD